MKNLLLILFLFLISANTYASPGEEENKPVGTWTIKNVQKMQGLVIRTKKYTKDGGDTKAFIKRFKGATITFNADNTVILVTPDGKKTVTGTWEFGSKMTPNIGGGTPSNPGHSEDVTVLFIKFPTARNYNIDGEYTDKQFGVSTKGKFFIIDPKYMFRFDKFGTDRDKEEDKEEEEEAE